MSLSKDNDALFKALRQAQRDKIRNTLSIYDKILCNPFTKTI